MAQLELELDSVLRIIATSAQRSQHVNKHYDNVVISKFIKALMNH